MGKHIAPFDNKNKPIIDVNDDTTPLCFFNPVKLKKGEIFTHQVDGYESVIVLGGGTCSITVGEQTFPSIGKRTSIWDGDPESVYVPVSMTAEITCDSDQAIIMIAGGLYDEVLAPFAITTVDKIQYGSDDTKTHRKIKHILGQANADKRGRLLVSELFTVGAGGWSGFPAHKHDCDRGQLETNYQKFINFNLTQGKDLVHNFFMNMKMIVVLFTTLNLVVLFLSIKVITQA